MMEYDVDLSHESCLYNTLTGYLARCKHGLHDDTLIEHYETVYQNNILYYNKILGLLRNTLGIQEKKSERIRVLIDNDIDLKEGCHLEIARLQGKCDDATRQVEELDNRICEATALLADLKEKEKVLEEALNCVICEIESTKEQNLLSYYALGNVKAAVSIQKMYHIVH